MTGFLTPKPGTLEHRVLALLIQGPVCHLHFPPDDPLGNEETLAKVIANLTNSMYESDDDKYLKFDS